MDQQEKFLAVNDILSCTVGIIALRFNPAGPLSFVQHMPIAPEDSSELRRGTG